MPIAPISRAPALLLVIAALLSTLVAPESSASEVRFAEGARTTSVAIDAPGSIAQARDECGHPVG